MSKRALEWFNALPISCFKTAQEKLLLLEICKRQWEDGQDSFPSATVLMRESLISRKETFSACLSRLEENNLLFVTRESGKRNVYVVNLDYRVDTSAKNSTGTENSTAFVETSTKNSTSPKNSTSTKNRTTTSTKNSTAFDETSTKNRTTYINNNIKENINQSIGRSETEVSSSQSQFSEISHCEKSQCSENSPLENQNLKNGICGNDRSIPDELLHDWVHPSQSVPSSDLCHSDRRMGLDAMERGQVPPCNSVNDRGSFNVHELLPDARKDDGRDGSQSQGSGNTVPASIGNPTLGRRTTATVEGEPENGEDFVLTAEEPKKKTRVREEKILFPFEYNSEIPEKYLRAIQTKRKDLHIERSWADFKLYWIDGPKSKTRRTENGWYRTWTNFLDNTTKFTLQKDFDPAKQANTQTKKIWPNGNAKPDQIDFSTKKYTTTPW